MAYVRVYQSRTNWENLPSMKSPLNEYNLNRLDYAAYIHDEAIDELFVTKAEQEDLLVTPHTIDYDSESNSLLITLWNGSTQTIYLPTGSNVAIDDLLATGQQIGTLTIDGVDYALKAPIPETGSEVSFSRSLSSGTKIGTITIDGTATDIYAPSGGSTVSVSRNLTSGTQIATITVNGTSYALYCETNTDHRDFTCGTSSSQSTDVLEFVWS